MDGSIKDITLDVYEKICSIVELMVEKENGIGKTETAKSVMKKIYSLPCDVTGIYQMAWVT